MASKAKTMKLTQFSYTRFIQIINFEFFSDFMGTQDQKIGTLVGQVTRKPGKFCHRRRVREEKTKREHHKPVSEQSHHQTFPHRKWVSLIPSPGISHTSKVPAFSDL